MSESTACSRLTRFSLPPSVQSPANCLSITFVEKCMTTPGKYSVRLSGKMSYDKLMIFVNEFDEKGDGIRALED